jgi:predicted membrane channel-forming protein YqfA (hemolysin III family)
VNDSPNNDVLNHEVNDALASDAPLSPPPASQVNPRTNPLAITAAIIAAWAVPGLGHLILHRPGRAILFFAAVGGLAIAGYVMRGNVFPLHSNDPFGALGFLADAGSGVFYLLSRVFEASGPDVSRAAGDYGTRFIAAAGVVNILGAFDAYEIASGRRS